jgi:heptosyltransferase II
MKLLIELPTWLGDTVMSTAAIDNLVTYFKKAEVTIIGSSVSIEALKNHPGIDEYYKLDKKNFSLYKTAKNLGYFDIFFTFRSSFRARIFKSFILANEKYQFDHNKYENRHQVEKYNDFINTSLGINLPARRLSLHSDFKNNKRTKKILGINPGASFGSAKRWYPEKFAKVAIKLADNFDILIFGSKDELNFASIIENSIINEGVTNYTNLAGKTSIQELIREIANLDLFITGDSGPMHIAASFQIPTISIFGPTKTSETSQWRNNPNVIITKNLDCQPCMKKHCPLKHHNCMKLITVDDVINSIPLLS